MDVLYCIVLCLFDTAFESYFDTALILFLKKFLQCSWQFFDSVFQLVILPAQEVEPQLKANATAQNVNFVIFTVFVSELIKNVNSNVDMNMLHFHVIQFFVSKENIYIYISALIYAK